MSNMIIMPEDTREAFLNQMDLYNITREELHLSSKVNRATIRKALRGESIRKDLQLKMVSTLIRYIHNRQVGEYPKKSKKAKL